MICNNCGKENLNSAVFCEQCGQPIAVTGTGQYSYQNQTFVVNPPLNPCTGRGQIITNLILAILFSSLPSIILSIVALCFRIKYECSVKYVDIVTANSFTSKIKTFMTISWIVLAVSAFIYILSLVFMLVFYFGALSEIINEAIFSNGAFAAMIA